MKRFSPRSAIIPVVLLGSDGRIMELLGTAFFVGSKPYAVTAKHVFKDCTLKAGESYGFVFLGSPGEPKIIKNISYVSSKQYDIAAFRVEGVTHFSSFSIVDRSPANTEEVLTYDFSSTQIIRLEHGKNEVTFIPRTLKGNVLCHYESNFPESTPTPVFEVSFPVLQGASGAPIVRHQGFSVLGLAVANREREIQPAQVVKVEHEGKVDEVTKYFLPSGKCISHKVLRKFLTEQNIDFRITSVARLDK